MRFAGVVIETKSDKVDNLFTYRIPDEAGVWADRGSRSCAVSAQVHAPGESAGAQSRVSGDASEPGLGIGSKVRVPFGRSGGEKSGYVFELSDEAPEGMKPERIKGIISVDPDIRISEEDVRVCAWMKRRCFCRLIDAAECFAPSGRKSKRGKERRPDIGGDAGAGSPGADAGSPGENVGGSCENVDGSGENVGGSCENAGGFAPAEAPPLTVDQKRAMALLLPAISSGEFKPFLLQGVTGSGKTEVYMNAAAHTLAGGRQTIVLVPEISLTHQTVARFVRRFGAERIAVLHSKLSAGERYDEWLRIARGEVDMVIGARSAVFAPMRRLGLIVVDEEHETTYKSDMIPKYDAVEVAMRRAKEFGACVILGSATPSVVSSYRAEKGNYKRILMTKRYNNNALPEIRITDMRGEAAGGNTSMFGRELFAAVNATLEAGKQVLLFLNRRGWAPYISCTACGYVMKCESCNISMTYHRDRSAALCHYCGARRSFSEVCPACGESALRLFGFGTEQLEEQVLSVFPSRTVARLDVDAAKKKGRTEKILRDFAAGKTDILVGTQMIAKGLDFARVGLVGAVSADVSLNIPDFRSTERTFQLITQVAGRAGRREERGLVYVQTYSPDNYAVAAAVAGDYEGFYRTELYFREALCYPPFSDVVLVTVYGADEKETEKEAGRISREIVLRAGAGAESAVLGPRPAPIARVEDDYRYQIFVKVLNRKRKLYEGLLAKLKRETNAGEGAKSGSVRLTVEVNPFSLL